MTYEQYLMHHGILGQKWGIRRFQNEDGSLTSEGRRRYGVRDYKRERKRLIREGRFNSEASKRLDEIDEEMDRLATRYAFNPLTGDAKTRSEVEAADKFDKLMRQEAIEMAKLEDQAVEYADRILESKYGKQTIQDLRIKETKQKNAAEAAAILTAFGAAAVSSVMLASQYASHLKK